MEPAPQPLIGPLRRRRRAGRCGGRAPAALLASALPVLASCSTSPRTKPVPEISVLEQTPASGVIRADEVIALRPGSRTWHVVAGDGIGRTLTRDLEPTTRFRSQWLQRESGRRTQFLAADESGNIVMPATIDHADEAITLFDPPLVLAWAELAAGETRWQDVSMRVLDAANPRRTKESGQARRATTYVDNQRLRTPRGEVSARRIEIEFVGDLRVAEAREHIAWYVAQGEGVVMEQLDASISILGLANRRASHVLMLERAP
jgi:hypothetical protein